MIAASLDAFAEAKLATIDAQNLRRDIAENRRDEEIWIIRGDRRLLSFSCNDYLNLSQHPAVIDAAISATRRFGTGACGSRLVTGNHPLFAELEELLAEAKGTQAACVIGSGYLANTGIIPVLADPSDLILIDELAHACIWAGATLSGARILSFHHNSTDHIGELLAVHRGQYRHALMLTEHVFSMDGDIAPISEMLSIAEDYDAWLMCDDAHGLGVVDYAAHKPPLQMGTLSKAVGAYGGYLCASAPVIDLVRNRARTFIYSTGLPPATIAGAIAALKFIARESAYCARPIHLARRFTSALGLPEATSPIVPLVLGTAQKALEASRILAEEGFLVAAIRPPTVPKDTARLRFTFTAKHPESEIDRLANIIQTRINDYANKTVGPLTVLPAVL